MARLSQIQYWAQAIIDIAKNENIGDMSKNGEYDLLKRNASRFQVILDVGANIGNWAKEAATWNPGVNLHCFEPVAFSYSVLLQKRLPHCKINKLALGSFSGLQKINIFKSDSGLSSLHTKRYNDEIPIDFEEIKIETLDAYCSANDIQKIDFLKIDVEGHEFEVLKGAAKMLSLKNIKCIQFEYGSTYIDAKVFLKEIWEYFSFNFPNYELFKIYPSYISKIENYTYELDNFRYSNYLFKDKGFTLK